MPKYIEVFYENGVLKPTSPLELKEHRRLRISLEAEEKESIVRTTSGILNGLDDNLVDEIANSPLFLPENS